MLAISRTANQNVVRLCPQYVGAEGFCGGPGYSCLRGGGGCGAQVFMFEGGGGGARYSCLRGELWGPGIHV